MEEGKIIGGYEGGPTETSSIQAYIDQPTHDPGENDVLFGRGGETNKHCGNKRFRDLVRENKGRYRDASKAEKPKVAKAIVQQWRRQNPPGRFLGKISPEDGWADVGDQAAQRKASKTLGEQGKKRSAQEATVAASEEECLASLIAATSRPKKMAASSQASCSKNELQARAISPTSSTRSEAACLDNGQDLWNQVQHSLDGLVLHDMPTSISSMNPNNMVWRRRNFSRQAQKNNIPKASKGSCTSGISSRPFVVNSTANTESRNAAAADTVCGGMLTALSDEDGTPSEQLHMLDPFAMVKIELDRNQSMETPPSMATKSSSTAAATHKSHSDELMEALFSSPDLSSIAHCIPTAADLTMSTFGDSSSSWSSSFEVGDDYIL